jgi:hypothetical protein
LKIHIVPFTFSNKLNLKPITSPWKKKARTHSRTLIAKAKDDEEKTCLEEIGGGDEKNINNHMTC